MIEGAVQWPVSNKQVNGLEDIYLSRHQVGCIVKVAYTHLR